MHFKACERATDAHALCRRKSVLRAVAPGLGGRRVAVQREQSVIGRHDEHECGWHNGVNQKRRDQPAVIPRACHLTGIHSEASTDECWPGVILSDRSGARQAAVQKCICKLRGRTNETQVGKTSRHSQYSTRRVDNCRLESQIGPLRQTAFPNLGAGSRRRNPCPSHLRIIHLQGSSLL